MIMGAALPQLRCLPLPAFDADKLEAVRSAFAPTEQCRLAQAWQATPDAEFTPGVVHVGWRGQSLQVFAGLDDADIFSKATGPNQRMWELGDVFEIFLSPENAEGYVELHVTPDNWRLQLRYPDATTVQTARAANQFEHLHLPDGTFISRVWKQPESCRWFVHAEIPASIVCGGGPSLPETRWRFSFSRYDYLRGRSEPMISSTSPHARPDFHRREEWGVLHFL